MSTSFLHPPRQGFFVQDLFITRCQNKIQQEIQTHINNMKSKIHQLSTISPPLLAWKTGSERTSLPLLYHKWKQGGKLSWYPTNAVEWLRCYWYGSHFSFQSPGTKWERTRAVACILPTQSSTSLDWVRIEMDFSRGHNLVKLLKENCGMKLQNIGNLPLVLCRLCWCLVVFEISFIWFLQWLSNSLFLMRASETTRFCDAPIIEINATFLFQFQCFQRVWDTPQFLYVLYMRQGFVAEYGWQLVTMWEGASQGCIWRLRCVSSCHNLLCKSYIISLCPE